MKVSRSTKAKTKIMDLIESSGAALSHSDIQNSLDGLCDRVTIYRVLGRLLDEGVIHKIVNIDGVVKYAACHNCSPQHNHYHVHFSCQKCKAVTCLESVKATYKLPKKYKVTGMNFILTGICPQCH